MLFNCSQKVIIFTEAQHIFQICPAVISIRYKKNHFENTKINMFIHSMHVDTLFLLTKVIQIMFEPVTIHTKLHKHG